MEIIITVLELGFQSTFAPRLSAINLTGINVLPLINFPATSNSISFPLTVAILLFICSIIILSSRVAVTVLVSLSQSTLAPNASNIGLRGTKVLPSCKIGSIGILNWLPSKLIIIGSANETLLKRIKIIIIIIVKLLVFLM